MNVIDFRIYSVGGVQLHPTLIIMPTHSGLQRGQACSVREIIIRQQQGLPLPPMTNGFVFNGLSIDELPKSSDRYADRSAKVQEMKDLQSQLKTKGLRYNVQQKK